MPKGRGEGTGIPEVPAAAAMKALTLMEPWGYAHVHLGKRVENRTWRIPRERYALHSGKSVDHDGTSYIESLGLRIDWSKVVPSAVFAVCDIVKLVEIDAEKKMTGLHQALLFDVLENVDHGGRLDDMGAVEPGQPLGHLSIPEDQRKWAFGPWAHLYDSRTFRILPNPVPCKGAQGLWQLPSPVWQAVLEQLVKMPPVVLNRHVHGKPQGAVYVGRPSKWGNPFTWSEKLVGVNTAFKVVAKDEVLPRFKAWLSLKAQAPLVADAKLELRGRDLVCSCWPHPCHADTWLEIANAT
ncbi:MAG: DUF4326 domain-containing protein [Vicinamibacteria bacterium]